MTKILFVCHGNICRSTMAEFIMKHLIKKADLGKYFLINSKATSTEELGNPPHPGTLQKLKQKGVPIYKHLASQIQKADYEKYDFIIGMDSMNIKNIYRILGPDFKNKVHLLLNFTENTRDIADPWYTHDFDSAYDDILRGCEGLLYKLTNGR